MSMIQTEHPAKPCLQVCCYCEDERDLEKKSILGCNSGVCALPCNSCIRGFTIDLAPPRRESIHLTAPHLLVSSLLVFCPVALRRYTTPTGNCTVHRRQHFHSSEPRIFLGNGSVCLVLYPYMTTLWRKPAKGASACCAPTWAIPDRRRPLSSPTRS